jgi:hypothetical protein
MIFDHGYWILQTNQLSVGQGVKFEGGVGRSLISHRLLPMLPLKVISNYVIDGIENQTGEEREGESWWEVVCIGMEDGIEYRGSGMCSGADLDYSSRDLPIVHSFFGFLYPPLRSSFL